VNCIALMGMSNSVHEAAATHANMLLRAINLVAVVCIEFILGA